LQGHLAAFLTPRVRPGDLILVAFSGGPDSTALLAGIAELAAPLGVSIRAVHLDHGLDADSARRAELAEDCAGRLGVPLDRERRAVAALRRRGESLEEAARRVRYDFLAEVAAARGARWVLTAHHRDDQAETLLLRLRQGSGLEGLAGIREERGALLRPCLAMTRAELAADCARRGLEPSDDPTNRDLRGARAYVRHRLLPALGRRDPDIAARLARVARAAGRALPAIEGQLTQALAPRLSEDGAVVVERRRLLAIPNALRSAALACLGRLVGLSHSPSARSQAELWRQLERGKALGCDCGPGWRWRASGEAVALGRTAGAARPFTYTFAVPGHCDIPEIGRRLTVLAAPIQGWMLAGDPRRAGLAAGLRPGDQVEVRNRRPGDRVQPLGAPGERKLKDVLMDRRIPRAERDRLPLLCIDGRVAWVPGVTVDERFRLPPAGTAWVARIEEL
jgi:tRNA(Ile)-lysidine synthase